MTWKCKILTCEYFASQLFMLAATQLFNSSWWLCLRPAHSINDQTVIFIQHRLSAVALGELRDSSFVNQYIESSVLFPSIATPVAMKSFGRLVLSHIKASTPNDLDQFAYRRHSSAEDSFSIGQSFGPEHLRNQWDHCRDPVKPHIHPST